MTRLVQIARGEERRVALVDEPRLRLLDGFDSVCAFASQAVRSGEKLSALLEGHASPRTLEYDAVYLGESEWRLLAPVDHPEEPARCVVTGTGLTHLGSASDRAAMHTLAPEQLTDSMRMFRLGLERGKPEEGCVGAAPEWFYKGTGVILRAHGEPLDVPAYAEEGGEEAEVAGVYLIGPDGTPWRIGFATGNEFSDHEFEKRNYLNLAGSKLRTCSIGPELVIGGEFRSLPGRVSIERNGDELWSREIRTGEAEMCHSLRNLEHHHFKFENHRVPGDVHVHFYGAVALSFGAGIRLQDGDEMVVRFDGFGRALRNRVRVEPGDAAPVAVRQLS